MIWTPHFCIGHLGRTGGDATKQILHAVLSTDPLEPNLKITGLFNDDKHRPFEGNEVLRILGFRRLPAFIMSIRAHHIVHARVKPWSSEFCSELRNGDNELKRMPANGKYPVQLWLRCEYLRDDLCALLISFYGELLTTKHKAILYSATTKASIPYDHNVYNFFNDSELKNLYKLNPLWAEREQRLYGSILV